MIEFLCFKSRLESNDVFYKLSGWSCFFYFNCEWERLMIDDDLLGELSESLKSNRDAYDIFYVNFITLSSFTIHGAYGLTSIPNIVNAFNRPLSNVGNIYGGSTFGKGIQIFTLFLRSFCFILISKDGRNCENLFLLGKISSLSNMND